ncbi:hypothetical protein HDU98_011960 [Podochytrium sp. JEL0797]|nr:hypothetical protein HDU98_011960 [Podochytrium sp. JEL0797]
MKTEELAAEDPEKVHHTAQAHPELEDDVELSDITDVIERIEFIVPQTDDPSTSAFTVRSFVLGTFWCILLSFANTTLSFRSNPFIGNIINPGPFTMKEHVLIFIMASSSQAPYGIDNVVVQAMPQLMNNTGIKFIHSLAFVLVTQFLGYGMSGLTRRFLVKPTAMWWPGNLSTIAIMSSFHKMETGEPSGTRFQMTRFKAFWIAFIAMFAYEWLPEFFMPVLQAVSVACIFGGYGMQANGTPNAAGVMTTFNAVAGSVSNGVGLLGLTFDWGYILSGFITSPFWASAAYILGSVVLQWIVTPILWAQDVYGINKLITEDSVNFVPLLNSPGLFIGNPNSTLGAQGSNVRPVTFYNVSDNYNLNLTAYNDVAPVHLTIFFAIAYAGSFLSIAASITHVFLWYGKDLYRQTMNAFRQIRDEVDAQDTHVKLMEEYPDVPDWVYLAFLGATTVAAIAVSLWTPFNMPWWAIFFNIFLCAIFILPFGVIQAISGLALGLNVLTEFVIGLMIPGQTVSVMAFKSWGTNNLIQSLALTQDLKLGQYLHIPPYAMVFSQFWGTFVNAVVSTGAAYYLMFGSGDLLAQAEWNFNNYKIFYSAGGIWGAIGPQRFWGIGSIYQNLLWCFLIGALLPILPWMANKYIYPHKSWHLINFPLMLNLYGPGGYQNVFVVPLFVSWFSQVYLFKHHREFYEKYIYVIGAAFDGATGLVVVIISIMAVAGISFTHFSSFNPNTSIVPLDYYCWPDADYNDYGCEYYLKQGLNATANGVSCLMAAPSA